MNALTAICTRLDKPTLDEIADAMADDLAFVARELEGQANAREFARRIARRVCIKLHSDQEGEFFAALDKVINAETRAAAGLHEGAADAFLVNVAEFDHAYQSVVDSLYGRLPSYGVAA